MSKLIQGSALGVKARQQALSQFVHRWTHENSKQTFGGQCPGCVLSSRADGMYGNGTLTKAQWHAYHAPIVSDAQWLADHAFYVQKDGLLDERKHHCEPSLHGHRLTPFGHKHKNRYEHNSRNNIAGK